MDTDTMMKGALNNNNNNNNGLATADERGWTPI